MCVIVMLGARFVYVCYCDFGARFVCVCVIVILGAV